MNHPGEVLGTVAFLGEMKTVKLTLNFFKVNSLIIFLDSSYRLFIPPPPKKKSYVETLTPAPNAVVIGGAVLLWQLGHKDEILMHDIGVFF